MKDLLSSGRLLAADLASTVLFLVVLLLTDDVVLAVALGVALGVGRVGWQLARRRPVGTMEWLSLWIVLGAGGATLLTDDPRFVMFKPTLIYLIVGAVMLKPGWMNRYLPPIARALMPDVGRAFGVAWAGLMFASAALNLVLVWQLDLLTWSAVMSAWGIASKIALFLVQYATMRAIGRRRGRSLPADERARLLAATD